MPLDDESDRQIGSKKAGDSRWRDYILPGRTETQFRDEGRKQVEALAPFEGPQPKYATIIDLGCGPGRMTEYLYLLDHWQALGRRILPILDTGWGSVVLSNTY